MSSSSLSASSKLQKPKYQLVASYSNLLIWRTQASTTGTLRFSKHVTFSSETVIKIQTKHVDKKVTFCRKISWIKSRILDLKRKKKWKNGITRELRGELQWPLPRRSQSGRLCTWGIGASSSPSPPHQAAETQGCRRRSLPRSARLAGQGAGLMRALADVNSQIGGLEPLQLLFIRPSVLFPTPPILKRLQIRARVHHPTPPSARLSMISIIT